MCAIMAEKLDQSITFPFRKEVEYLFANPVMDKELSCMLQSAGSSPSADCRMKLWKLVISECVFQRQRTSRCPAPNVPKFGIDRTTDGECHARERHQPSDTSERTRKGWSCTRCTCGYGNLDSLASAGAVIAVQSRTQEIYNLFV